MGLLIYGATGYSGELIARRAVERGLRPVLAARRADAVTALARELGLVARTFALDDPSEVDRGLAGTTVLLNCAGPFSKTVRPLTDACLRAGAHYLDITGEVEVFAALFARDAEAQAAGVMLLPGVGFDVVPSDCLAAHLARRMPGATRLRLAFRPGGGLSRGTALTTLQAVGRGGLVRRGGVLTPVPIAHASLTVDFGRGPTRTIAIPWGDIFTAGVTTGIPDIEVFIAVPRATRVITRLTRVLGPLLQAGPIQRFAAARIRAGAPGPSEEKRKAGHSLLWGEVRDAGGHTAVSRMETPEGYELTRLTAVALAEKVLAGAARPGFQTPARAFGPDLILEFPGVRREDVGG